MNPSSTSTTSATDTTTRNPEGVVDRASSSAHAAVDEAARKASPAIDHVAEMAHHAVDAAAQGVAPAAEWLSEHRDTFKATEQQLLADTRNYVHAHPLASLGMAVVAGFVLSRILRA